MQPGPSDQYVQSLVRGLAVIRSFDAEHQRMTLTELATRTDLTRATARRFLHTLLEVGYVGTDGKSFFLTPRVLELGYSYLSSLTLPEIAQPHLDAFSRLTGESSSMSVLDGGDIVYVARAAVRRIMSVSITVGSRFPAHLTSMGRVLMASAGVTLDSGFDIHPRTPLSLRSAEDINAELMRVRAQGYALVNEELELGLRSLAVPILGAHGSVVAAINVSVSAGAYGVERMESDLLPHLRATAESITGSIGAA